MIIITTCLIFYEKKTSVSRKNATFAKVLMFTYSLPKDYQRVH